LRAIRVKKWEVVPDPKVLIDQYKNKSYLETLRPVIVELSSVEVEMVKSNNQKASSIDVAWNLLLGGLGITLCLSSWHLSLPVLEEKERYKEERRTWWHSPPRALTMTGKEIRN
ncbi:MAG: hypothetical protein OK455_04770, partial [Thaumarchaeota archaeon]|nr:hypothetical protein [Nitrososphaerota archaeon]